MENKLEGVSHDHIQNCLLHNETQVFKHVAAHLTF